MKYCLDASALIEISKGNPKFADVLDIDFVITSLTLAEFYSAIMREHGESDADNWQYQFEPYSVEADPNILKEAIKFRHVNKKKNISLFDAASYIYAVENNLAFVTCDKEFEGLKNVEFKKK